MSINLLIHNLNICVSRNNKGLSDLLSGICKVAQRYLHVHGHL